MELSCDRLRPALGATATLPSGLGDVSDELADEIHSALMDLPVLVSPARADLDATSLVRLGSALGARHSATTPTPRTPTPRTSVSRIRVVGRSARPAHRRNTLAGLCH